MKKLLILITIISITITWKLAQKGKLLNTQKPIDDLLFDENRVVKYELTFSNTTGRGVTADQISFFIQMANYASLIYGTDIQPMMKYLKYRMDKAYGNPTLNFFIFLQTQERNNNHLIWVDLSGVCAGLQGINKIQPSWSYFFAKNTGYNKIEDYNFIKKDQKGTGITEELKMQLKDIIKRYETEQNCTCSTQSLNAIQKGILQYSKQSWSILCDDGGVTNSLIQSFQKQWISLKVKSCYYSIYR